jgi:hypothetical protein
MRRLRVAARSSAAAIAVALLAPQAPAQPARPRLVEGDVTLEYRLDPSAAACPGEPALRERAADAFDFRDPFVPAGRAATSHMRVEIARTAAGFEGTVLVVDDSGAPLASSSERHADCDALVWVLGHRVALAILRRPSSSPSSPASAPPASSAAPSPRPAVAPFCDGRCIDEIARRAAARRAAAGSDVRLTVAAGGLFTAGFADVVAPGVWLGFSAQRGWLSIGVEGRGAFPAPALTYAPGRSSLVTTLTGLVVPCARYKVLSGCAFVEAGSLLFTIPGNASAETAPLLTLGPRAAVDIPIAAGFSARVFAELALHPYLPAFRVRFTTAPDSPIVRWVTPIASGVFGAGLTWSP